MSGSSFPSKIGPPPSADFLRRWRDLQTMEHGSARIRLEIFLKNYIQASF